MVPLPDAATKALGTTAETIKGVDFGAAAADSEGDPLGEGFADFAVDIIRDKLPELLVTKDTVPLALWISSSL